MLLQEIGGQSKPDAELMEEIRNIFTVYDDDRSGSLDEDEFGHALGLCGECSSLLLSIDNSLLLSINNSIMHDRMTQLSRGSPDVH